MSSNITRSLSLFYCKCPNLNFPIQISQYICSNTNFPIQISQYKCMSRVLAQHFVTLSQNLASHPHSNYLALQPLKHLTSFEVGHLNSSFQYLSTSRNSFVNSVPTERLSFYRKFYFQTIYSLQRGLPNSIHNRRKQNSTEYQKYIFKSAFRSRILSN